jgi:hydrogenase maturation protease
VHAGRRIFGVDFPADLTVYLIEAGSLQLGTEMTAPVNRAVELVCARIAENIRERHAVAGS